MCVVHIHVFRALSCILQRFTLSKILLHASSLIKFVAPSFPACYFLLSHPILPSLLQQLLAAGYYWSILTSISAYRGMTHQNTHTHKNTELDLFCAYKNTWHYHARLNAQKHSCFLLTSSRFLCSVTKLQEQGRAAKELKPHSLILKKPSSLLLLLLFVFLPHILCHVVITGTLTLCTRDKCTSQQDTEGLELVACTLVTFWLARHLVTPLSHRWLLWLLFEWLGRPVSCKAEGCAERMAAHMHKQRDVHVQNATQNMPHTYRHLFFTSALHEWF